MRFRLGKASCNFLRTLTVVVARDDDLEDAIVARAQHLMTRIEGYSYAPYVESDCIRRRYKLATFVECGALVDDVVSEMAFLWIPALDEAFALTADQCRSGRAYFRRMRAADRPAPFALPAAVRPRPSRR